MNNKKSLLFFTENSITDKNVLKENYVVSKVGYFFKDIHDRRCKVLIESDLNISLTDSFITISEEEAKELIKEKSSPDDTIKSLKEENKKLKEIIAKLKKK